MVKRFWRAAASTILAAGLALGPQVAAGASASLLSVESGNSTVLQTPGLARVEVGDGRIAGVVPIGTSQIVVTGKAPGHTTVVVWTAGGRSSYEVTVTEAQLDDLAELLRATINQPNIEVLSFNHSIVVRGTVADGGHYQVINDLVTRFAPYAQRQKDVIIDAVTVEHPIADLQRAIANLPGASSIRVDPDGKGNVIVSGNVHDAVTAQAILERTRGLAGPYLASDGKLIDRIATDTTSQIDIKVYVLEVDRTALDNLGLQLQSASFQNGSYTIGAPSFPVVENPQPLGGALKIGPFFRAVTLAPTLNLLMQQGHARVLSAPDLVTLPGSEATFLVGGEIPIPFNGGPNGQIVVEYKEFGVRLNVTPTLLGNGSVETKVAPEVSNLDFSNAISANGFLIPALKESKLSTDVITQSGESIIMGGLLQRIEQRDVNKIPILGDLPILGRLFRSTRYQTQQSDVVFVMTPVVITR
ncbi:MAG TPA: pilus assembly protein N-terminal domain-containing protein [Candidatus Baltobacteraceae bacterium]|nr:pilus assembly protein N-terminal domain-containing protein [Candidatus Baltobacteraceae bacterium]